MRSCKDCVWYDSPKHYKGVGRGLGFCRKHNKEVSPYDKKCKDYRWNRMGR